MRPATSLENFRSVDTAAKSPTPDVSGGAITIHDRFNAVPALPQHLRAPQEPWLNR